MNLFKQLISKEICRAECEYINTPPTHPINDLVSALNITCQGETAATHRLMKQSANASC